MTLEEATAVLVEVWMVSEWGLLGLPCLMVPHGHVFVLCYERRFYLGNPWQNGVVWVQRRTKKIKVESCK